MNTRKVNDLIDEKFIPDIEDIVNSHYSERKARFNNSVKRNYLLALGRLFLFFGATSFYIVFHLFRGIAGGFTNKAGADTIQRWAKDSLKLMGVTVIQDGDIPSEGALMVSNHRSYMDITVAASLIKTSFLAKSQLKRWPILGIGAKIVNVLFVNRDSVQSRRESRENIKMFLNSGTSFFIYPEGTTTEGPGLLPFRPGVFDIAAEDSFPVVPVAVYYDDIRDAWIGKDTFFRHFFQTFSKKKVVARIAFGPVIKHNDPEHIRSQAWNWINNRLSVYDAMSLRELQSAVTEPNPIGELMKNFNQMKYSLDNILMKLQYNPYKYEFLYKPGTWMNDTQLEKLTNAVQDTALTSFDSLPDYQIIRGTREEYNDKVIAVAWRPDGKIAGFCSTVLLPVEGVGEVQHLGLTVVRPEDRSNGLTHILTSRAVKGYLMKTKPLFGKLWISNCAAVLSSLVSVARYFEEVHPSPFTQPENMATYEKIAAAINTYYRDKIYINDKATFDEKSFVFRRSVEGTVFKKDGNDTRFFHRNAELNNFYKNRMNFSQGDEVLQIGYASTFAALRHMYARSITNTPLAKKNTKRKSA